VFFVTCRAPPGFAILMNDRARQPRPRFAGRCCHGAPNHGPPTWGDRSQVMASLLLPLGLFISIRPPPPPPLHPSSAASPCASARSPSSQAHASAPASPPPPPPKGRREAKQSKAKQSKAKQSEAKRSEAKQSKAKQSKKQSIFFFFFTFFCFLLPRPSGS
jgi:hypothetical protein